MKTLNTFRAELSESPAALCQALRHVAEARRLALPAGDDLELSDVQAVLRAAGLRLAVVPTA